MPSMSAARSHACVDLGLRRLARAQAEGDVLEHRQVGIERVVLEHHRDVAVARAQVVDDLAADLDRAAVGLLEAGDGAQQRALAATRRPDEHGELARRDVEVDAAHGVRPRRSTCAGRWISRSAMRSLSP